MRRGPSNEFVRVIQMLVINPKEATPVLLFVGRLLERVVPKVLSAAPRGRHSARVTRSRAPQTGIANLGADKCSRDKTVVRQYDEDPAVCGLARVPEALTALQVYHGPVQFHMGLEMYRATKTIQRLFEEFDWPLLIMHGGADVLTLLSGSQQMHERVRSKDKTLKVYDGLYHEIFNEPERDTVFADMLTWMGKHLQASGSK